MSDSIIYKVGTDKLVKITAQGKEWRSFLRLTIRINKYYSKLKREFISCTLNVIKQQRTHKKEKSLVITFTSTDTLQNRNERK